MMGYTCHGCRHGKPCVKEHLKRAEIVEAHADTLIVHAALYPPKKQAPGVYVLSVEEIKALHSTPLNLPSTALGGPCHCPVCDPALHKADRA